MPYQNKTYVAFDADSDIHYYRLMQAWKQSDNHSFDFFDAHDINNLRATSSEVTIKAKLKERLNDTRVFVLLVGEKTKYLYQFVRWEIEQALKMELPIICVNLNGNRSKDTDRCPPILNNELTLHVSFNAKIIEKALSDWERLAPEHNKKNKKGDFSYSADIYRNLGL